MTKFPHITWMFVMFVLALMAIGVARANGAALMAFAVGVGWELAETTVVGHNAALIDLLPDLCTVAAGWLLSRGLETAINGIVHR